MTGIAVAPGRKAMPQQRMDALRRANRVRLARAELKRNVACGSVRAADVILTPPWEATSMPVDELLTSQRRWGTERARRFLASMQIPENKQIGTMTERQRTTLSARLNGEAVVDPFADRFTAINTFSWARS